MKLINLISLSLFYLCFLASPSLAQKVGINKPNPSEELDVNGNINLTGEVKIDGVAGENGQFLQATGNGEMQWTGFEKYSNFKSFNSSTTWTVPSGVTEIKIEAWGGGGGGAQGGGGGAGGYLKGVRTVSPGSIVTITIGSGGSGNSGSGTASNGANTVVSVETGTATVYGGDGADNQRPGSASSRPFASSSWNAISKDGNGGHPSKFEYSQRSATVFVEIVTGGDGGDSYGAPGSGGKGSQSTINQSGGTLYRWIGSTRGAGPGAGGGGASDFGGAGGFGDSGQVIIYW